MRGNKYLRLKDRTWWFGRDIPADLRPAFGDRKTLLINLRTSDLKAAQQRRDNAFAESEARFLEARTTGDPIAAEAAAWAEERRQYEADPRQWIERTYGPHASEILPGPESFIDDKAEEIEARRGPVAAERFKRTAYGVASLDAHLQDHLREASISPRTAQERQTAVARVTAWKPSLTLRSLGRQDAGRYVSEVLAKGHAKTGNKALSNLSSYWRWLVQRGHVSENPWQGQRLNERRAGRGDKEREFTDSEVRQLLSAPWPARMREQHKERLHDAMLIAALSGLRIEEICRLKVADCADGLFDIRQAKTRAGERKVPIHADLKAIVRKRTKGKQPEAYLIAEIEKVKGERSMPLSKQFTRYRRAIGVDEVAEGQRRARINFHSWRRWFATKAERAGQHPHIIEAVLGHKRLGMTLGVYSGGPSVEKQMRACVEAVELS